MHVHVSAIDFFVTLGYLLIAQFLLRALAAKTSETAFGKGLASIID